MAPEYSLIELVRGVMNKPSLTRSMLSVSKYQPCPQCPFGIRLILKAEVALGTRLCRARQSKRGF